MQHYSSAQRLGRKFGLFRVFQAISYLVCLGLTLALVGVPIAVAEASQVNISQGFKGNGSVVEGSLAETDPSTANTIIPATSDHAENLVGVVVRTNESLLSVTSSSNDIQVATSGTAYALVSDINGDIKIGDRITASPISGVGMKATTAGRIIGIAQTDFSKVTIRQAVQVKDKSGASKTAQVGRILVLVDISTYTGQIDKTKSIIPSVLQDLSDNLAGKQVSPVRIILGTTVLLIALLISIILVYGAVRSSIVSIGRNPLSQSAVGRGLFQVLGFVVLILLVTLLSVYLILSK